MTPSNMHLNYIRKQIQAKKSLTNQDAIALLSEIDSLKESCNSAWEVGDKMIRFIKEQGLLEKWAKFETEEPANA
jgi:hypothetical protein